MHVPGFPRKHFRFASIVMASADSPVWTANSNQALHLSLGTLRCLNAIVRACAHPIASCGLVRAKEDTDVLGDDESHEDFHPTFTYPVRVMCITSPLLYLIPVLSRRYSGRTRRYMVIRIYELTCVALSPKMTRVCHPCECCAGFSSSSHRARSHSFSP